MIDAVVAYDRYIITWVNGNINQYWLQKFFAVVTMFGNYSAGWVALFIIVCLIKRDRKLWLYWGLTLGITLLLSFTLKELIHRERPYSAMPELEIIIRKLDSYSFPSIHASISGASFVIFMKSAFTHKTVVMIFILSVLVALSRVVLKMHYPSDVLAGYCLGVCTAVICWKITCRIKKDFTTHPLTNHSSEHQ